MARSPSTAGNQENVAKRVKKEKFKGKQRESEDEMDGIEEEQPSQETHYDEEREPSLPSTEPINNSQQEGGEYEGSDEENDHEASSSGRKRQRLNEDGESIPRDEPRPEIRALVRDPTDKYVSTGIEVME
jgi:hypothetical protein